ncbi:MULTISPECIES: DUF1492 domain-containing protein [unclassified Bacillus (in: firmicutes)]|uniref:DUF1492 domain-containing protein n=1 Tax=unclassified Bacillus (in: firmicutes) TaxID=185979 RepID=UPI00383467C5
MVCLKDYQRLEEEIAYLEYKLEKTKADLKCQSDWDKDILSIDPGDEETGKVLDQLKDELISKKKQLQQLVDLVSKFKSLEQQILKMKYIDGMKLDSIAEELKYSPSYIKQKHAEIMRRIRFAKFLGAEE